MTVSAFLKLVTSIKEKELRNNNNRTSISLNYFNRCIPFNDEYDNHVEITNTLVSDI